MDPPAPEQPIAASRGVTAEQAVRLLESRSFSIPSLEVGTERGQMFVQVASLTSGCLRFTFRQARFILCYDGTASECPKGLTQAGLTLTRNLANKWNGKIWTTALFSCVFADRHADVAAAGLPASLAVNISSQIHGALRHLQNEAHEKSQHYWRNNGAAGVEAMFRLYIADGVAVSDYAGTIMGYEGLDDLTKRAVPIIGGDRGQ